MANTRDFVINGNVYSFSQKSVKIDDVEYPYIGITAIKHSSKNKFYMFQFDEKWHKVPYDDASQAVIGALFKKVAELNSKRAARATATAEANAQVVGKAEAQSVEKVAADGAEAQKNPVSENQGEISHEEKHPKFSKEDIREYIEETGSHKTDDGGDVQEEKTTVETVSEETLEVAPAEIAQDAESAKESHEAAPAEDGEDKKKRNRKKALIIFAIVIAAFAVLAVVIFMVWGLPTDPTVPGDGADVNHQYNDIDELIKEMQE